MATKIDEIEGIGPAYAEKLKAAGISSVEELLEQGGGSTGRDTIAEGTGISGNLVLEWVNHADLFRIKGVGSELSDLLEAAGVDTVPELAQRNAENLHKKLGEVNEAKNLVRQLPSLNQVTTWIEEAKTLPRKVTH